MSVIQFKCKKCGAQEYVIKEVPNGSNVHKGLYCAKCGAWEKWLSKDDVVCGAETTKKTTAKERVEEEIIEVEQRLDKLLDFIHSDTFKQKMNFAEKRLLTEQAEVMQKYVEILTAIITIWREI